MSLPTSRIRMHGAVPPLPHILASLLTQWNLVFLEMLTGSQLVKKFPAFYGTQQFITAFTSAHHLSLS
jgi:hypothetical protein